MRGVVSVYESPDLHRPLSTEDRLTSVRASSLCDADAPLDDSDLSDRSILDGMWREYKATNSDAIRNYLIIHYMNGHVRRIAGRLRAQLPPQVDVDDLVDEAYEGLVHAIEHFDPGKDVRFETFSSKRLFGAMRDYLRRIDPVPRLARTRSKHVAAIIDRFQTSHGRAPDPLELKQLLRISTIEKFCKTSGCEPDAAERARLLRAADATFRKIMLEGRPALMVSFNGDSRGGQGGSGGEGHGTDEGDAMANFQDRERYCPLGRAEINDLKRWVTDGFPRRDRLIIILYYYEHLTMKEIGTALGCSESRVSQRLESILQCLRSRLERTGAVAEFYCK